MNIITFYNKEGKATAYTQDEKHIFLFSGRAVAYLSNDSVYSYTGKHLGRFQSGWIRDNRGLCVFFTESATGGPMKPMKSIKPVKGIKSMKPIKGIKQIKPMKPMTSQSWSELSVERYFDK